jgi:hypothetical protein
MEQCLHSLSPRAQNGAARRCHPVERAMACLRMFALWRANIDVALFHPSCLVSYFTRLFSLVSPPYIQQVRLHPRLRLQVLLTLVDLFLAPFLFCLIDMCGIFGYCNYLKEKVCCSAQHMFMLPVYICHPTVLVERPRMLYLRSLMRRGQTPAYMRYHSPVRL